MRQLSIHARLTIWYSVVLVAVLGLAGLAVVSLHNQVGLQRIDNELAAALQTVKGVIHNEIDERLELPRGAAEMLEELNLPGVGVAVLSTSGEILASTGDRAPRLSITSIRTAAAEPSFADDDNERIR